VAAQRKLFTSQPSRSRQIRDLEDESVLLSDHRLASRKAISPADLVVETFVTVAYTAPVLRGVIDNYLKRSGIHITPPHEIDHVVMGMTVIASTHETFSLDLSRVVLSKGNAPTVDLVLGYKKSNKSPILKPLLSRLDELVARVSKREKA
jgi:LysR family hca operon transcriptional activator